MPRKGTNYCRMMLRGSDSESDGSDSEPDAKRPRRPLHAIEVGRGKPDALGKKVADYALTEDDIRKMAGNVPIYRYPDLAKMSNPDEMFKGAKAAVLLFLTDDNDTGHWLTVLNHPEEIEVFDSFGVGA